MALGTFSGGGLGMGVAFTLVDRFSSVSDKIALKFKKLDGVTTQSVNSIARSMKRLKSGLIMAGIGAAVLAAVFVSPIKRMIALSDNMADVQKTTGLATKELTSYRKELQKIDTRTSLDDLLLIGKIGGQIGVAKKELLGFTIAIDQAVVALGDEFSGGAEQVASELGKINSIFGVDKQYGVAQGLTNIGSAINALGAAGLATAPFLSDFAKRLGPVAVDAGITASQVLGLGAALEQLGASPEAAASSIQRFLGKLQTSIPQMASAIGESSDNFKKLVNEDGNAAMLLFAERMVEMHGSGSDLKVALKGLGLTGVGLSTTFAQIANNTDLVRKKQMLSNLEFNKGTSLLEEYNIKNNTLAASLDKMGKKWDNIKISIGELADGPFSWLIAGLDWLLSLIGQFLNTWIGKFVLSLVLSFSLLALAIGLATAVTSAFTLAMGLLGAVTWTALLPFVLIGAAIVAVTYAIVKIVEGVKKVRAAWAAWDGITPVGGVMKFFMKIAGTIEAVSQIWKSFNGDTFTLTKSLADKLQALGILDWVIKIGTFISRIKAVWNRVVKGFVVGWGVLKGYLMETWGILKNSLNNMLNMWKSGMASVKGAVQPLIDIFHKLTKGIFKTKGSLSMWKQIGNFLGKLAIPQFKVLGFTIKWVVQIIFWLLEAIIWVFIKIVQAVSWLVGAFIKGWLWITDLVWDFISFLGEVAIYLFDAGVTLMQSLWDGFKSLFPSIASWITKSISSAFGGVAKAMSWIAEKTGQAWDWATGAYDGGDDPNNEINPDTGLTKGTENGRAAYEASFHKNSSKSPMVVNNTNTTKNNEKQPIIIQNIVDGDMITEKVIENMEFKQAVSN